MAEIKLTSVSEDWDNKYREDDEEMEFFTELALHETERWIQAVTRMKFAYDDPRKSLEDGILLCELLNSIKNGSVKRINRQAAPIAGLDNLNVFLKACKTEFGLSETQLFDPADLEDLSHRAIAESDHLQQESDRRLRNVAITIYWLGRAVCQTYQVPALDFSAFTPIVNHHQKDIISNEHIYRLESNYSWQSHDYSNTTCNGSNGGVARIGVKDSLDHHHTRDSSYESYASYGKDSEESLDEHVFENMPVGRLPSASPRQDGHRYSGGLGSMYQKDRTNGMYRSSPDLAVPSFNHRRSSSNDSLDGSYRGSHSRQSSDSCDGYATRKSSTSRRVSSSAAPDPLQFVKTTGTQLAKQAEEQLKMVEETKKIKTTEVEEIKSKDDDWMSSLGNWKSRRKSKSEALQIKEEQEELAKKKEEEERSNKAGSTKSFKQMQEERERRKSGGIPLHKVYPYEEDDDAFISPIKSSNTETSPGSAYSPEHSTVTSSTPSSQSKKRSNVADWAKDSDSDEEREQPVQSEAEDKNNNQRLDNKTKDTSDNNQSNYSEHNHSFNHNNKEYSSGGGDNSNSSKFSDLSKRYQADVSDLDGLAERVSRRNTKNNDASTTSTPNKLNDIRNKFESPEIKPATRTAVYDAKVDLKERKKSFENLKQPDILEDHKPPRPLPRESANSMRGTVSNSTSTFSTSSVYASSKDGRDFAEKTIKITSKRGFGFTVSGGADKKQQLIVEKVSMASAADVCELKGKDEILSINKIDVSRLTNQEAKDLIRDADRQGFIEIRVRRLLGNNVEESDEFLSSDEEQERQERKIEHSRETTQSFDSNFSEDSTEPSNNYSQAIDRNMPPTYSYSDQPLIQQLKNDATLMQYDPQHDSSYQSETASQGHSSYSSTGDFINTSTTDYNTSQTQYTNTSEAQYTINTSQPSYVTTSEPNYVNINETNFMNSSEPDYVNTSEPNYMINTSKPDFMNGSQYSMEASYGDSSKVPTYTSNKADHHDYVNTSNLDDWAKDTEAESEKEPEVVMRRKRNVDVESSSSFDETERAKTPDSGNNSDGPPDILRKWQRQRPKSEYLFQDEKPLINQKRLSAALPWQPDHRGIGERTDDPVLDRTTSDYLTTVSNQPVPTQRVNRFNQREDRRRMEEWNNQQEQQRQPAEPNENHVETDFTFNQAEFESNQEKMKKQYEEEQKRAAEIQLQKQQQERELLQPEMERTRLIEERKSERRLRMQQMQQNDKDPVNASVGAAPPMEVKETRDTMSYSRPKQPTYQNVYEPDYVNQPVDSRATLNIQVSGNNSHSLEYQQMPESQRPNMSFTLPGASSGLIIDPRNRIEDNEPVTQYSMKLNIPQQSQEQSRMVQPGKGEISVHDANFIEQEKAKIREEYLRFEETMRQQHEEEERKFREREEKLRQQEEHLRQEGERIRMEEEKLAREKQNMLNRSADLSPSSEPEAYQPVQPKVRGQSSLYKSTITSRPPVNMASTYSTSVVVQNNRTGQHGVRKVDSSWPPPNNNNKQPGNITHNGRWSSSTSTSVNRPGNIKPSTSANKLNQEWPPSDHQSTNKTGSKTQFAAGNNTYSREDMLAMNRQATPLQKKPEGSGNPTSPTSTGPIKRETPTRREIHSLNAVPKPKLRQSVDWIGRGDNSNNSSERRAPPRRSAIMKNQYPNTQDHWLIEEAERRRTKGDLNMKSATLPIQPGPYNGPIKPPRSSANVWSDNSAVAPRKSELTSLPPRIDPNMPQQIRQTLLLKTASARGSNGSSYSDELNVPQMSMSSNSMSNTMPASYGYDSARRDYNSAQSSSHSVDVPSDQQQPASLSGKQLCSSCSQELGFGAAMIIQELGLYYHMTCFKCCVCHTALGNGSEGADVRIRVNKLHCPNCYSNDEGISTRG